MRRVEITEHDKKGESNPSLYALLDQHKASWLSLQLSFSGIEHICTCPAYPASKRLCNLVIEILISMFTREHMMK